MHPTSLAYLFICLISGTQANATDVNHPMLNEASLLVESSPETSLEVAERFIAQRELGELNQLPVRGHDAMSNPQSLLDTIQAYMITARAQCALENKAEAWEALAKARFLVEENGLKKALLEITILEAQFHYYLEHDEGTAQTLLQALFEQIPARKKHRPKYFEEIEFEARLLEAIILSKNLEQTEALQYFELAEKALSLNNNILLKIQYQIALGHYFLCIKLHERALSELLSAYWLASENDYAAQIARANRLLTTLFTEQGLYEQAIQHATQAAEYYERHKMNLGLSRTQKLMGDVYHQQKRYNFALVHYFNTMDIENTAEKKDRLADVLVAIADTYLRLERYPRAQKYLSKAISFAENSQEKSTMVKANLLQGEMDLQNEKLNNAVQSLETAMKGAKAQNQRELLLKILPLLSIAYEQKGDFRKALERQRYFETINIHDQSSQQHRETESFKHSQQAIERQLLLEDMQRQHTEDSQVIVGQKKVNLFLVATIFVLLSFLSLRHHLARSRFKELQQTQKQLYTHTRTGLRNLLRLKDNLPQTLKEKHEHFEQLYLMEMIHQPLSDKLRFAMFRVPFLETIHLQYGYKAGLSLEQKLGAYFKEFIHKPARLYHFSDCTFIYIEPNANSNNIPEWLSHKIQSLIDNFIYQNSLKIIDGKIHIGMAEIPFLPRAFTTIGDQELIEILLMATNAARQATETENGSQWVHLSAIDSTPAAYFAKTNLRDACLKGIDSGFIKVKTSATRGINWQTLHGYTRKPATTIDKIDNKS